MTQGLAEISTALDARTWLREQIIQWTNIRDLTQSTYAEQQLTQLTMLDNNLADIIAGYEGILTPKTQ